MTSMGPKVKSLLHSKGFALALFCCASAGTCFYTIFIIVEAPIFAALLPDTAKIGCYIYFVKGLSGLAIFLVPVFTKRGKD